MILFKSLVVITFLQFDDSWLLFVLSTRKSHGTISLCHSFHVPSVVTDSEDIHLVVRFVSFLDYDFFTDIFFKIVSVYICVYDRT